VNTIVKADSSKEDFLKNIKPFTSTYGNIDITSINTVERNSGLLKVTTASILGSKIIQKFIMVSNDKLLGDASRVVCYMESNLPLAMAPLEKEHFTGYLKLVNFSDGKRLEYKIKNGNKTNVVNSMSNRASTDSTHWGCVSNCVNKTMNDMSWGTYIICLAALPECSAGVFLGCEIDCTLN